MVTSLLHWLEFLLLPPGFNFILLLGALIFSRRAPLVSFIVTLSAILLLVLLSMPLVARQLLLNLQIHPAIAMIELTSGRPEGAIVILGGGRYASAPEYGYRDEISTLTLERLRYGATIAGKLKLPILLSGGRRNSNATSEAVIMNQVMVNVFNIHPQFLEINAVNTIEQAEEVKKILANKSINKIYLVTHAWHMQRAVRAFVQEGIEVTAAPVGFAATSNTENLYLPSASALASSSRAIHEYYGLLYLKYLH